MYTLLLVLKRKLRDVVPVFWGDLKISFRPWQMVSTFLPTISGSAAMVPPILLKTYAKLYETIHHGVPKRYVNLKSLSAFVSLIIQPQLSNAEQQPRINSACVGCLINTTVWKGWFCRPQLFRWVEKDPQKAVVALFTFCPRGQLKQRASSPFYAVPDDFT